MSMNLSGTCATTKLIQCKSFGIYECDVTAKFYKHPSEVPDLAAEDLAERRKVAEYVQAWREKREAGGRRDPTSEWTPILYVYEVRFATLLESCLANLTRKTQDRQRICQETSLSFFPSR